MVARYHRRWSRMARRAGSPAAGADVTAQLLAGELDAIGRGVRLRTRLIDADPERRHAEHAAACGDQRTVGAARGARVKDDRILERVEAGDPIAGAHGAGIAGGRDDDA